MWGVSGFETRQGAVFDDRDWEAVTITDATGKTTYNGAFVTSLAITPANVVEISACARARWKIENEGFNVLKNNGYNLAHNFGHGKKYLARTFAAMNLLAFAFHTVCACLEHLWQQVREVIGSRSRLFRHLHTITSFRLFPNWNSLFLPVIQGKAPPIQKLPDSEAKRWLYAVTGMCPRTLWNDTLLGPQHVCHLHAETWTRSVNVQVLALSVPGPVRGGHAERTSSALSCRPRASALSD